MKKASTRAPDSRALRQRAEQRLRQRPTLADWPLSEADARAVVHELQVHQIELEMQNEELHRAQAEAEQAADKYTGLFDFAPVGYFVLDPHGVIREVNLAGAALLGLDRRRVTGQPFNQHVAPDGRAEFTAFCRRVCPGEGRCSCETRLLRPGHEAIDVLVEGTATEGESGEGHGCRLAVTDITGRKRAEEKLRQFNAELERRVAERTGELRARNEELTRFNRGMVGRELRMVDLKREINELCRQTGQPPRYPLDSEHEGTLPPAGAP